MMTVSMDEPMTSPPTNEKPPLRPRTPEASNQQVHSITMTPEATNQNTLSLTVEAETTNQNVADISVANHTRLCFTPINGHFFKPSTSLNCRCYSPSGNIFGISKFFFQCF